MPRSACCWSIRGCLAAVVCLLAACDGDPAASGDAGAPPRATTSEAVALPPDAGARAEAALEAAMAEREIREVPAHRHAAVDLDGDDTDDLLVLLDDPAWCTEAGCTLFVFQRQGGNDVPIAQVANVRTPISVAEQTHGGWRDILVTAGGVAGVPTGTVALQHDGIGYPEDPTLMAALAASVLPRARVVVD